MLDFNDAEPQREMGLIEDGTIVTVHTHIRSGGAGDGGWLKRSKGGDSLALDAEFTVIEGPYANRKFWTLFTLDGTTDGHAKAGAISRTRLRAMLESARGILPTDTSDAAKQARTTQSYEDFEGLRFVCRVGVEKAAEGSGFKDKNQLAEVITPDKKAWVKVDQVAKKQAPLFSAPAKAPTANGFQPQAVAPGAAQNPQATVGKPDWATRT
jgi:hypothetical protein